MSVYFDASVLVSMWVMDAHSEGVDRWSAGLVEAALVSGWAAAEFTSAVGARLRNGTLTVEERDGAELALDAWLASVERVEIVAADFALARRMMRSTSEALKAGDALHLAAARRLGATLATVDRALQRGGRSPRAGHRRALRRSVNPSSPFLNRLERPMRIG